MRPKPVPLTRAAVVTPIAAFLARAGVPVAGRLAEAGLPSWILGDAECLIPTVSVARLLSQAARAQGIADLGLRAGLETRLDALGVLGRLICRGSTLRDALQTEVRHHRAFTSDGWTSLTSQGDEVHLRHAFTTAFDERWQQVDHYRLALMLGALRLAAGPLWRPAAVWLQTGESPALREFEPLSGVKIHFGQASTGLGFSRWLLDAPLWPSSDARPPSTDGEDVAAWVATGPAEDFAGSIVQIVQTLSWEGYPHIHLTADFIGMSVRTLQRHLASVGATHESIVARARLGMAMALLRNTDTTILDVALDVGYSDHAHFTRAFRRWTGRSPQEFRRERRGTTRPDAAAR